MIIRILCLLVLMTVHAEAATYYVSKTASNGYAVGSNANSCVQAQSKATPKNTIDGSSTSVIDACVVGGDTIIVNEGTYTNEIVNIPGGTASAHTIIMADPASTRPILQGQASPARVFTCTGSACAYITVEGFEITTVSSSKATFNLVGTTEGGWPHHVHILNNVIHDTWEGFLSANTSNTGYLGGDHLIRGNEIYRTNMCCANYSPGANTIYNPGNRTIIERNSFHNMSNAIGIWHASKYIQNVIVRNNHFYNIGLKSVDAFVVGQGSYSAVHISVPGGGHKIYNNTIWNFEGNTGSAAININPQWDDAATVQVEIYNNSFYDFAHGTSYAVRDQATAGGPYLIRNNIALSAGQGFVGGTQSNNRTTGTASDIWTDPTNGNLTLKAGSAAIDAGTSTTGLAFCGTAPDQGAYESLKVTAASINGDLLDVTICNTAPPIIPGTFTVARSGGTPTVLSTSILGGSGGIVRLHVSEVCAAAQTWTVSAGTTTTDSALVGNSRNQPLHTVTNFPIDSSACTGSGAGGAPAGAVAIYNFEGNLNDSSGNANHSIGSGSITYTTGHELQGVLTQAGVNSYVDTGLLSGHNPSTTHLVVSAWVYVDAANLGQTKDIWGTPITGSDRFFLYRSSANVWRMGIGATSGAATEFPVSSGWTHACIKMHPTGDIATMYINGTAGTIAGASVVSGYGSYTFAGTLRFGLPSGFATSLSGAQIFDQAYIYTTDVSCTDLYNAGQPATGTATVVQAAHRWHGVYTLNDVAENRGAIDAQRNIVKGGVGALMVQLNCTGGSCGTVQPRFRYNINGGAFTNVVPDAPTADGVSYWGTSIPTGLNNGLADGPISGALSHTDGVTLTTSVAVPTIEMANNTSYTLRGIFSVDAALSDVVCFKVYDQGGSALASYTPSAGSCLTVIAPQASGAP